MISVFLAVGSNLGNRSKNIRMAVDKINQLKDTRVVKISRMINSKPIGGPPQRDFLNGVIKIKTELTPSSLLKKIKTIEKQLGRKKTVRNGPRPLDLDIVLYGSKIINRKDLIIPHPKMFERKFVIEPLLEII